MNKCLRCEGLEPLHWSDLCEACKDDERESYARDGVMFDVKAWEELQRIIVGADT